MLVKEVTRKAIHACGFVVPLAYYFFLSREILLLITGLSVAAAAVTEYIRLSGIRVFPDVLLRGHEEKGVVGGYFYAILAGFLAVLLFDKTVAIAALLFLYFGDAITGLSGALLTMFMGRKKAYGRDYDHKGALGTIIDDIGYALRNHKSPLLMMIMFAVCGLIGLAFYPALSLPAIALGALGAVIGDAFPWRFFGITVDDNLSIPLLAGALMTVALLL